MSLETSMFSTSGIVTGFKTVINKHFLASLSYMFFILLILTLDPD